MSKTRTALGWLGLIAGLTIAFYFLVFYAPVSVAVRHTTNPADHAFARIDALEQIIGHSYRTLQGAILGLMLSLLAVFFCGPFYRPNEKN